MDKRTDAPPVYNIPKAANDAILRHYRTLYLECLENAAGWERDGNKEEAEYWRMRATQYDYA